MRLRIKFAKSEPMKFTGHLDVMRVWQRVIRKTGVPIAYSVGFNPHPRMSIAFPLSLGMTSVGEYLDIDLTKDVELNGVKAALNANMPVGMEVLAVTVIDKTDKNAMAEIAAARYAVVMDAEVTREQIDEFMSREAIIIEKKTKKNTRDEDIRPDIKELRLLGDNELEMLLTAGSIKNLKPELVIRALYDNFGWSFVSERLRSRRIELYKAMGAEYVPMDYYRGVTRQ